MELFKIFLAAVFVKNIVFIRFLALCSFRCEKIHRYGMGGSLCYGYRNGCNVSAL